MTTTRAESFTLPVGEDYSHFYRMATLERIIAENRRDAIARSGTGTNFAARNDYRTRLATLDNTNPVPQALQLLGKWLGEKRIDLEIGHDNYVDTASQSFDIILTPARMRHLSEQD